MTMSRMLQIFVSMFKFLAHVCLLDAEIWSGLRKFVKLSPATLSVAASQNKSGMLVNAIRVGAAVPAGSMLA
jgi:hypothetical protein